VNPVADGVDDLTTGWLSQALGKDVRAVTAERVGTGQTGETYRLSLDVDYGRSTIVAKLAAGDEAARRRVARGYRCEVGFYVDLVETLDLRTPRCSYAAITDDALAFTLLLEDLAPRTPGVQADGCSVARAEDAVRNLAGLHAPRWNDESLFALEYLDRRGPEQLEFFGQMSGAATAEFVQRYRDDLDSADVATLREAAEAVPTWQVARTAPFAVVHGDYRLDNLLFPPEGDGVVVVDWQTLTVAPPARDLAYFLGTSLTVEYRRTAEEDLARRYHRDLVVRGVRDYNETHCFDDYRLGQLQGPMITTIGAMYATADRSPAADAMFLTMARRSCTAIRDLRSLDLL
jgi:hypothetical protein